MALLWAVEPARVSASFRLGWSSAREVASMPEESYDKASPSRGRKSRLRADCCNTTAPQAIGAPQDLLQLLRTPLQNARGRFALLTGADWQSPRIAGKMARVAALPRRILLSCSPQSTAPSTFSFRSRGSPET